MKRSIVILMVMLMAFGMVGCSKGEGTQTDNNAIQSELETAKALNTELQTKNASLIAENKELKNEVDTLTAENGTLKAKAEPTVAAEEVSGETMTYSELDTKLLEQPMYVDSSDYIVQSEDYKSLYPDMLNAVIKNNSGTDVKTATVAFVAWDENNFPVKIAGQFDFNDGNYVKKCEFDDVNMVDGSTYGEDMGFSLNEQCDNIKIFKVIVMGYTDFDGNEWENPYYDTWVSTYENKKLVEE